MTKRKRDLFTVIESINNLFEASNLTTNVTEGSEGETSGPRVVGTSSDPIVSPIVAAELIESIPNDGIWAEDAQVVPSHNYEGIKPQPHAEVATSPSFTPRAAAPLAAPAGYGLEPGGDQEDPHLAGYQAGIGSTGTSDLPGPRTTAVVERQLTIDAFWRLLADAGYDIW